MKTLSLLVVVAAAMLISSPARAELVIYRGTLKQSGTGLGVTKKIASQFYLIVDHDTAHFAGIQYTTVNGSKIYATETETNMHFVQMSAPKGISNEAISQPPNDCDISQGNTNDLIFVQGADSQLTVNTGTTITFPKSLSGTDNEIDFSSGSPISVNSTLVVSFDKVQTPLSNGNAETLDAAVARISGVLEGKGYVKQTGLQRKSRRALGSILTLEQ